MEKRPVVMIVGGRGGVPTIPEKMQGKPGLQDCAGECTGALYSYLPKSMTTSAIAEGHNPGKKRQPSQAKVAAAFHEVMHNEPSTVARADVSEKRKQKMRVAIALHKARKA